MMHIPTVVGVVVFFGICYAMSVLTLTGLQTFIAIVALVVVYSATIVWYIRTNQ
jgi:hypothetical protein